MPCSCALLPFEEERLSAASIALTGSLDRPAAAPITRLKRDYRYHFVLKAASREKLNGVLRSMIAHAESLKIPRTNVIVDMRMVEARPRGYQDRADGVRTRS